MDPRRLIAGLCSALALSGCAGLPIGRHEFIVLGIGLVRIDRADKAVGVSSRSIGLTLCPRSLTLGVQASYCASIPIDGDVAIIERGSGPDQHLSVIPLRTEKPQ